MRMNRSWKALYGRRLTLLALLALVALVGCGDAAPTLDLSGAREVAQTLFEQAEREWKRQESLKEKGLTTDKDHNDALANLEQRRIEVQDAERELGYTEVRAPMVTEVPPWLWTITPSWMLTSSSMAMGATFPSGPRSSARITARGPMKTSFSMRTLPMIWAEGSMRALGWISG